MKSNTVQGWSVLLCSIMAGMAVGCGGASVRPPVAEVKGIVLYNGDPVEGALVQFVQDGCATIAAGKTDSDGAFVLTSYASHDGAPVGEHKVTVTKTVFQNGNLSEQASTTQIDEASDPGERRKLAREKADERGKRSTQVVKANKKSKSALPIRYSSASSTSLKAIVERGVQNEFQFSLTD